MKRNIIISILVLATAFAEFGYYLYNKGPLNVKDSEATSVAAAELYENFIADSVKAFKNYTNKVLKVNGKIIKVSLNQQKEKVFLLETGSAGAYINCTMEEDPGELRLNDMISIKGICSGIGQGDADLGIKGDVYLTRCYQVKTN